MTVLQVVHIKKILYRDDNEVINDFQGRQKRITFSSLRTSAQEYLASVADVQRLKRN